MSHIKLSRAISPTPSPTPNPFTPVPCCSSIFKRTTFAFLPADSGHLGGGGGRGELKGEDSVGAATRCCDGEGMWCGRVLMSTLQDLSGEKELAIGSSSSYSESCSIAEGEEGEGVRTRLPARGRRMGRW